MEIRRYSQNAKGREDPMSWEIFGPLFNLLSVIVCYGVVISGSIPELIWLVNHLSSQV